VAQYLPRADNPFLRALLGDSSVEKVNAHGDTVTTLTQHITDTVNITKASQFAIHPRLGPSTGVMSAQDAWSGPVADTVMGDSSTYLDPDAVPQFAGSTVVNATEFNGHIGHANGASQYLRNQMVLENGDVLSAVRSPTGFIGYPMASDGVSSIHLKLKLIDEGSWSNITLRIFVLDTAGAILSDTTSTVAGNNGSSIDFGVVAANAAGTAMDGGFVCFQLSAGVSNKFEVNEIEITFAGVVNWYYQAGRTLFGPATDTFGVSSAMQAGSAIPDQYCLLGCVLWIKPQPGANAPSRIYGITARSSIAQSELLPTSKITSMGGHSYDGAKGCIVVCRPRRKETYLALFTRGEGEAQDWESGYINIEPSFHEATTTLMVQRTVILVYGVIQFSPETPYRSIEVQEREFNDFFAVITHPQFRTVYENHNHRRQFVDSLKAIMKTSVHRAGHVAKALLDGAQKYGPLLARGAATVSPYLAALL